MNTPEVKITEIWKDHLEYFKDTARIIDGRQVQFIFHIFLGGENERDSTKNR